MMTTSWQLTPSASPLRSPISPEDDDLVEVPLVADPRRPWEEVLLSHAGPAALLVVLGILPLYSSW